MEYLPLDQVTMFSLSSTGCVGPPLWRTSFKPVPLLEGPGRWGSHPYHCGPASHWVSDRFFNQCIQKKGLCDFNDGCLVVVIGGCEGSAVLAVVELATKQVFLALNFSSFYTSLTLGPSQAAIAGRGRTWGGLWRWGDGGLRGRGVSV